MSELEDRLVAQVRAAGLPEPSREVPFAAPRRWRFDLCWPYLHLAAEVDGGTWSGGRHTRGKGYEQDCEKLNAAAVAGYRVLRFTAAMIEDGRALEAIAAALGDGAESGVRPQQGLSQRRGRGER